MFWMGLMSRAKTPSARNVPSSGNGLFNLDITNSSQGGNAEIIFNFAIQQEV